MILEAEFPFQLSAPMEEAEGRLFSILGQGGNFVNTLLDSKGVLSMS